MFQVRLLSNLLGFCSIFLITSLLCVEASDIHQNLQSNIKEENFEAEKQNAFPLWPWDKKQKFTCPTAFGNFPDPEDCSYFYVCVMKVATHKRCKRLQNFDKNLRVCVSFLIAVCDNSGKSTTQVSKTDGTTPKDDKFTCPGMIGSFLHPHDCSKYYTCTLFIPSLKTCPENQLFDGVKKLCKPAEEVHCGSRIRPTESTIISETTTEIIISTTGQTEDIDELTTPSMEVIITSTVPDIPTESTIITSTRARVTAPDTNCDVDDLDCIIDDLGETPDWFVCEKAVGSYPHPTSQKLFIFCLNWKPSVKKCGQDLVFSEEVMTCISP